jgi:single-stranded-DNA-specific exonuclease
MTTDEPFGAALATFRDWLGRVPDGGHTVVLCHFDADGLAAGALFGRGLPLLGLGRVTVVPSLRDESAFSESARDRLRALTPDALVVTDLGVSGSGTLEADGVPTLYVDHHRPSGTPADGLVVSGYDWEPVPCSAWLAYALLEGDVPDVDEMRTLDWIAAVGVISDLGDKAPWPGLADAKRRHTATALKEATVLVNAARRGATFRADDALALLLEVDGPRELAEAPQAAPLHAARAEVAAAMAEARKRAPVFSATEPFALVTVDSPCQVHPLVAQQWRTRLPKHAVICANTGYLPGLVAFSTRTARTDLVLPQIYQAIDTPGWNGEWGHGHDQASGGHLPPDVFDTVLDALGFAPAAHVAPAG